MDYWLILYRNKSRETSDMVVAWLDKATAEDEIERYVAWDRNASGAAEWELIRVPRQERPTYYKAPKKKSDPSDLLEYHFVLEDYRAADEELMRAIK